MRHLILGAGAAGLSLACALVDAGVDDPITLVDARTTFARDRTWCLFDVRPTPFVAFATHRWTSWAIGGVVGRDDRRPYLRLDSADVYAWAPDRLERGAIPMTAGDLSRPGAQRAIAVGTAGGAVRPSSGYAFGRIQAQVASVVADVLAGRIPDGRVGSARLDALDAIFLRVLADEPERFPDHFRRLAERVPAPSLARFMGDASTVLDEALVMAAPPATPFASAALRVPGVAAVGGRATVDPWSGHA